MSSQFDEGKHNRNGGNGQFAPKAIDPGMRASAPTPPDNDDETLVNDMIGVVWPALDAGNDPDSIQAAFNNAIDSWEPDSSEPEAESPAARCGVCNVSLPWHADDCPNLDNADADAELEHALAVSSAASEVATETAYLAIAKAIAVEHPDWETIDVSCNWDGEVESIDISIAGIEDPVMLDVEDGGDLAGRIGSIVDSMSGSIGLSVHRSGLDDCRARRTAAIVRLTELLAQGDSE